MIELNDDRLPLTCPEVHPHASLQIEFQRTLRIPDDGKAYPLPPGRGRFPLRHVDDHAARVPASWMERGGVVTPMYQSEAMWLNFTSGYPFAIKVATGKINAVTGEPWKNELRGAPQDYMVAPTQPGSTATVSSRGSFGSSSPCRSPRATPPKSRSRARPSTAPASCRIVHMVTPTSSRWATRALLLALLISFGGVARGEEGEGDAGAGKDAKGAFQNPYFDETKWRVWRDDDKPLEGVTSMVREGKEKKAVQVTLTLPDAKARTYPEDPPKAGSDDPYIVFKASAKASKKYAGMWDDVYSSWSGLHGYIRTRWRGADGSNVTVRGQLIDFVDVRKNTMMAAGVNFIHQSTTSMGHAIANGRRLDRTESFEKIYFANLLVTGPAHASLTDHSLARSTDLYTAHISTFFQSMGSSNSETMAISKMVIAGAYLPPETKLLLKRNGLYPAALLYMWKAALPYAEPYDHELRHRLAYKSVGDRVVYSQIEKYSASGIDRGDLSLPYHCYDDGAHMRAMVDIARSMDVAMPEAVFDVTEVEGEGDGSYHLAKAAMIIQEKDQDVTILVSTAKSYDLQALPLTVRWKLLYGNRNTSVVRSAEAPDQWTIRVPWDDALPEGRTAIALIANNGRFDSNPAIITVYRKKSADLPPSGLGPKDYKWSGAFNNQRPVLLGLQDQYVKRGGKLDVEFLASDPEGFPISFYKRAGEPGEIDGSHFEWRCPRKEPQGARTVTVITSDLTGGSSYAGEAFEIHIDKPAVLAQIKIDKLVGKAPFKVRVSGKPSLGRKLKYRWDFYTPKRGRKATPVKKWETGREATHTFDKPGVHEIALEIEGAAGTDTETIRVLVLKKPAKKAPAAGQIEGNGVFIAADAKSPNAFDHTDFGMAEGRAEIVRTFRIINLGDAPLRLDRKEPVGLTGPGAGAFRVVRTPRRTIYPRGSALFEVRFRSKEPGLMAAVVEVRAGGKTLRFAVAGTAR